MAGHGARNAHDLLLSQIAASYLQLSSVSYADLFLPLTHLVETDAGFDMHLAPGADDPHPAREIQAAAQGLIEAHAFPDLMLLTAGYPAGKALIWTSCEASHPAVAVQVCI